MTVLSAARRTLVPAVLLALVAPLLTSPAPASAAAPDLSWPGAKQGSFLSLDAHNGTDELRAQRDFEASWGRRSDLVRVFTGWTQPSLFTPAERTLAAEGRTLVLSWNSWNSGTGVPWAQVANGSQDALIDARAAEVKAFGKPLLFTFQHEPEHWTSNPATKAGTPAEYCSAYRHVVDRFRSAGVTNASYGQILMAWSSTRSNAEQYYCGDADVDWLAADGYNWYGCVKPDGPWRMPAEVFNAWYAFGTRHGKPMVITEWGTGEDPAVPGRKAAWIDALNTYVKARPTIKGVMIYSTAKNKNCPRYADTSPSSLAAFQRMGADPYYGAPAVSTPTAPQTVMVRETARGAATATWDRPADNGGAVVSSYTVTWQGPDAVVTTASVAPDAFAHSVSGLAPGTRYTVTVRAVNSAGPGLPDAAPLVTAEVGTPGAPRALAGSRGPSLVTLTWQPPLETGATPVSEYRVRRWVSGVAGPEVSVAADATGTTVTGLTNGTGYVFEVVAVNAAGAGLGSERTGVLVPATTPGAPRIGTAQSGVAGGTVTATAAWSPPVSTGGAPVTGYTITAVRLGVDGKVLSRTQFTRPETARSAEVVLPVAGQYAFTVNAVNSVGSGPGSARSAVVTGQ